jgi:TPP-dependent indolepyruvate ferredoxin oxidoreductase alpha subunit
MMVLGYDLDSSIIFELMRDKIMLIEEAEALTETAVRKMGSKSLQNANFHATNDLIKHVFEASAFGTHLLVTEAISDVNHLALSIFQLSH